MLYGFENAFYDSASVYKLKDTNQRVYVKDVLESLSAIMPSFKEYRFYFFCATANIEPDSMNDAFPRKILIQWEDQLGTGPSVKVMSSFVCVFKTHLRKKSEKYSNLFSYPLGIPYKIKEQPFVPILDRKYNVFYSGNLNKNRVPFYEALARGRWSIKRRLAIPILKLAARYEYDKKWRNFSLRLKSLVFKIGATHFDDIFDASYIEFTRSFEAGLTPDKYGTLLANSKIILSPKGFFNTECFRFYEALRQGCIVITEKLPATAYYHPENYIEVESWDGIDKLIQALLTDDSRMEKLSLKGRIYYQNTLSPMGVAKYIVSKINVY